MKRISLNDCVLPAAMSICLIILIDLFTNSVDIDKYSWDFRYYIAMAENGFGNKYPVAPFAYRFGATIPVFIMKSVLGIPVSLGFKLIAYVGAWTTLFLVYIFMRLSRFSHVSGLLGIFVVAASQCHVKFLQFDVYRPDHLAYPLIILAMLLLLRRKWIMSLTVCVVGLQIREFLIIPLLIMLGQEIMNCHSLPSDRKTALLKIVIIVAAMLLATLVPRLLIPVVASGQNIDPFSNLYSLKKLLSDPLNLRKSLNYILSFLTYMLPSILLLTPNRIRRIWHMIPRGEKQVYCAYTALVLILALYGGTDYNRFMTYFFLTQLVILGCIVDSKPYAVEVLYMLIVLVLVNKVFLPIPIWNLSDYLDSFGGWSDRINRLTFHKFAYLIIALVGSVFIRTLVTQGKWAENDTPAHEKHGSIQT